ncbi:TonB-dependent receptor [Kiritimatiellaeota bacterium B1221]|nr:TonB-dependent receptor [Kiritimatiellaeota bacterium B1221]
MKKRLLVLALTLPLLLQAQQTETTEMAPLVVSSDPTDNSLPTFSTSNTRLSVEDFEDAQAHHLQDSLGMVPNLTYAGATSRPRYLQLRGVGERSQFSGEGPPNFSVGVFMDDIDLSGLAGAVSLFDVQSVDVLRGPQATLYGSRALAGAMIINSAPPAPLPENRFQFSVGTDDLFEAGFATGGPWSLMNDELFYRASFFMSRQNGYRENVYLEEDNTNRRQEAFGRIQFLYTPMTSQSHQFTLMGSDQRNGYDTFATTGDGFTTYTDEPGEDTLSLLGASLRSTYENFDSFDLISITSGSMASSGYGYDADWGNDEFWAAAPYYFDPSVEGYRYSFTEQLDRDRDQIGQEFRFQNKKGEGLWGGKSDWSTGLVVNWLEEKDEYVGFSSLNSDYEALTLGGYGQLTTAIDQHIDLVTSLRIENRSSDYSDSDGVSDDVSDWMYGGRVALEAELDQDRRVFIGASRGFKGGGVNSNPNLSADQRIYDPETLWNLETGLRQNWAEGRGYLNLTVFYMWRRDLQIGTSIQPNPADPTSFTFYTDNAAEGSNYGAEIELQAPLSQQLELFASLGLLETEYSDFEDAGGNLNVEGREQPYAPNYTYRTGLRMNWTEKWFTQVAIEGVDSYYFSDSHNITSNPYELVNLTLAYRTEKWTLSLWGRNIFDTDYDTRGYYFGNEPPDYPSKLWTTKGDPAQFGITWEWLY